MPESELLKVSTPMSDDRLKALLRQKSLLEEHLKWIEAEIAESKRNVDRDPEKIEVPANRIAPETTESPAIQPTLDEPDQAAAIPDIYQSLGPETKSSVKNARLGCIALFAAAFLALGGIVWLVYHLY